MSSNSTHYALLVIVVVLIIGLLSSEVNKAVAPTLNTVSQTLSK